MAAVGAIAANRRRSGGSAPARSAPTLDYPTAANPPVIGIHLPADAQSGDSLRLFWSQDVNMASGVSVGTHTLSDSDAAAGTYTGFAIPTLSTGAPWYFSAQVGGAGDFSNTVAWNDAVAPTITTSATASQMELFPLAITLAANEPVSWSISGGADQTMFEISGTTLRWIDNGIQDFNVPRDVDQNNTAVVDVKATDLAGNTTTKTITVTTTAADKTCDAFSFTDVVPSTPSTVYTSNTVTIAGLTSGVSVSATVTGATYSKNGGAFVPAGSFTVQNGDTVQLRLTSGSGATDVINAVLNVNGVSDTWTVSNTSVTTTWNPTTGLNKHTNLAVSGGDLTFTAAGFDGNPQLVRATASRTGKKQFEVKVTSMPNSGHSLVVGVDDGTTDFNPSVGATVIPGNASNKGVSFANGDWGWELKYNSVAVASDYSSGTKALTLNDVVSVVFDLTPAAGSRTVSVYRNSVLMGTVTGLSFSSLYAFAGDDGNGCTGVGNFGATSFTRTLGTGESAYG